MRADSECSVRVAIVLQRRKETSSELGYYGLGIIFGFGERGRHAKRYVDKAWRGLCRMKIRICGVTHYWRWTPRPCSPHQWDGP